MYIYWQESKQILYPSFTKYIGVAVTHVRNKNSNIQGRSPNVVKVFFHTIRQNSDVSVTSVTLTLVEFAR